MSEPLTEENIAMVTVQHWQLGTRDGGTCGRCGGDWPCETDRLVAEVRRLRSDEWLEKAAQHIASTLGARYAIHLDERGVLEVLRKHRDGKA